MPAPIPTERRAAILEDFERLRAEPGMNRTRAVEQVAQAHGVGTATVGRLLRARVERGTLEPQKMGGRRREPRLTDADVEALVAWVRQEPSLSLYQLQRKLLAERGVEAGERTIRRGLKRRGLGKRRLTRQAREAANGGQPLKPTTRFEERHRRPASPKPHRDGYPSDLTDTEWALIEPLMLEGGATAPREHTLRDVVDAILYQTRTGCAWRYLPHDLPPHGLVQRKYLEWMRQGIWDKVHEALRDQFREQAGRNKQPTVGILDSQTAKSAGAVKEVGYDGAKKTNGRKRHVLTDVLGLILVVVVHAANIQDRDGGALVINEKLKEDFPELKVVFTDAGYQGRFERAVNEAGQVRLEVVHRRGDSTSGVWAGPEEAAPVASAGFQVVPKRWIVERTFGWLVRWRRLARDFEVLPESSRARVLIAATARMVAGLAG